MAGLPSERRRLVDLIAPLILEALQRGETPVFPAILAAACSALHGEAVDEDQRSAFLGTAAPMARKIALALSPQWGFFANTTLCTSAIKDWYGWTDPLSARVVDLHYFAGLSVRRIARLIDRSPQVVLHDLKTARDIVRIKLPAR